MVKQSHSQEIRMPGRFVPAFALALGMLAATAAMPVVAQVRAVPPSAEPPISSQPVPNGLELSKLIWSTMAAIDHANQSGNYSVLRDISAPGFQILNNATRLSQIFTSIRESRVDLSNALLLAPTYSAPPQIVQKDVMRVRGSFGLRPVAIGFDLYYQWIQGKWRLYGVSIDQQSIAATQPSPPRK